MATVLLIEDDASQRFVAAFALKKAGHAVHEAADGPAGVQAARALKPDVIVCDLMMPGMTGYEVLAMLRASPDFATLPFILLTAMSDRKHMRQGMVSGADDYLTKPYKPDELCEAVSAVLVRRQTQQEAFMSSMSDVVVGALEEQKEQLGRKYESRLEQELNARWTRKASGDGDLFYPVAVMLLADLQGAPAAAGAPVAETVKRTLQQSRDTLYLFGADHVLPYASELLAVFAGDEASPTVPVELRAARAAFALAKAAARDRPAAIALHRGALTLIAVQDELHGGQGHSVVPGDDVARLAALREFAKSAGWRVACSPVLAARLPKEAEAGRTAQTLRGDEAVELVRLTA
jgi:CheY-like chemotaxis protein